MSRIQHFLTLLHNAFFSLNFRYRKLEARQSQGTYRNTTAFTPLRFKTSAAARSGQPAPTIATFINRDAEADPDAGFIAKAVSVMMYFSTLPMVTAPKPSFSVQRLQYDGPADTHGHRLQAVSLFDGLARGFHDVAHGST